MTHRRFYRWLMLCLALFGLALLAGCSSAPVAHPATPTVALVLGGGGAKGFAHIGVIRALEEHHIKPDLVVGTSAGAIVGAIYASGKSANELTDIALNMNHHALLDIQPSKQGLMVGKKLQNFVNTHVQHRSLEQLPTRFVAVATHKNKGTATPLYQGDTGLAVQASAAVPTLFIAPRIPQNHGEKYIDGGQSALLPAQIAKNFGAKVIISVDVLAERTRVLPSPAFDSNHLPTGADFWQLFEQFVPPVQANPQDVRASDIVITPKLPYSVLDTSERMAMIQAGYDATLPHIAAILSLVSAHKSPQ